MVKISVLEFRREAKRVIGKLRQGQRIILTYRGNPVARMEPIAETFIAEDDPIYSLADLAVPDMKTLTNKEIDRLIYEK
jgi:antitoxin (DNA-binding transcriptional repressor) of toxin-antitoxin stability system